jgi:hypothetical protein
MIFEVSFDAARVLSRLDDAIASAEGMRDALPAEFSAWQEEDVNRRQADTNVPDPSRVYTVFHARPPKRPAPIRRQKPPRVVRRRPRVATPAPILRPELQAMLQERMRALLKRTFAPWA